MILSSVAAETIKQMIVSGEYKAGDRLPNEMELANLLNVSRTTIREAIKILVSKNIVTIRRGMGTFVNKFPGIIDDPLGLEFVPEEVVLRDLCEMRNYLEPFVAALAAKRADRKALSKMDSIIESMHACSDVLQNPDSDESARLHAREKFSNCEQLFHGMIYEMSGNIFIKRMQPAILKSIHSFYSTVQNNPDYDYSVACRSHERICLAIKSGVPRLAYRCALEHMLAPSEQIVDILEELSAEHLCQPEASVPAARKAPPAPPARTSAEHHTKA